jgi:hypothetical protein
MFSSNQIIRISGPLDGEDLHKALTYVLQTYYDGKVDTERLSYQVTEDGKFCIGWTETEDWKRFQFNFSMKNISTTVESYLKNKGKFDEPNIDGCMEKGFLIENIDSCMSEEMDGIKSPFYGIVKISPYTVLYAK